MAQLPDECIPAHYISIPFIVVLPVSLAKLLRRSAAKAQTTSVKKP
jgi:hypothetical protein